MRFESVALHILLAAGLLALFTASPTSSAAPRDDGTVRNEHDYALKMGLPVYDPINRMWRGEAVFTISACPQAQCFHVSGRSSIPPFDMNRMEGSFPLPEMMCNLHFQNIPRNGYDSPDWRVTMIGRNGNRNGCDSLPPGLAGDYNHVANR